tara:strand:- start:2070 stop:3140 length:1071 start_codon:yes stop_codon:yes gene_type:complete
MKITKIDKSRIDSVNFTDIPFGRFFSDHMLICHYKNGKWLEPEIKKYGPILMPPGAQVLHYGQSVFEGMKAFKDDNDNMLLFRKRDNFRRLNKSAHRLSIPTLPEKIFFDGLDVLLSLDAQWCKKDDNYSLYVRPFIFASGECVKASESDEYTFMIITSPTTTYYAKDINVVIEESYTRAAQGGVGYTKASGNYAASFYPTKIARKNNFTQVIWTDAKEHKYIEEAGTMNIWFKLRDKLITPAISDSILAGITRDSIIKIARGRGIEVEERRISVDELIKAYENNELQEAFGSGTAVSISPISSITYQDKRMILPKQENSAALELKSILQDIQRGRINDKYNWIEKVNRSKSINLL